MEWQAAQEINRNETNKWIWKCFRLAKKTFLFSIQFSFICEWPQQHVGLTLSRSHLEGNKNIQIVLNKIQDERLKADGLKAILWNVVLTQLIHPVD